MSGESTLIIQPGMATIFAAFVGFLGGTIINHFLVQRREARARKDKIISLCQGLIGEISTINSTIGLILNPHEPLTDEDVNYHMQRLKGLNFDFYKANVGKLGVLNWDALGTVQWAYAGFEWLQILVERHFKDVLFDLDEFRKEIRKVWEENSDVDWQLREIQISHFVRVDYIKSKKQDQKVLDILKKYDPKQYVKRKKWFDENYTRKFVFDAAGLEG